MTAKTELAVFENYPALAMDLNDFLDVVEETLGQNGAINRSDLFNLKVPGEGGRFIIPSIEGDEQVVTNFEGIIVGKHSRKAMWPKKMGTKGSVNDPLCTSNDGITGVIDENHPSFTEEPQVVEAITKDCATCPYNEFNSAFDGNGGKQCKDSTDLFVLRPASMLPMIITCPPTSLKPLKTYLVQLLSAGVGMSGVMTRIGLEESVNANGSTFNRLSFQSLGRLGKEEAERAKAYSKIVANWIKATPPAHEAPKQPESEGM